jgi:broad specificity phosphatase PhoE
MITRLIFVRHAEAEGNFTRVFQGWTDGELTPKGHLQARLAAEELSAIQMDVLYSSSLKRTLQTAQCISEIKNLPIIRTDKLKEINGGDWEGERWEDLPGKWPSEYDTWENKIHVHQMPNGESIIEFQKRLIDEVKYIAANNTGKNICIVTHGTAIRAMMAYFRHKELEEMQNIPWYDNTSITIVDFENNKFTIILEGDASHLDKEMSTLKNQDWWSEHIEKIKEK